MNNYDSDDYENTAGDELPSNDNMSEEKLDPTDVVIGIIIIICLFCVVFM